MKTIAILQARMNSTRLPGKSLLPLAGKPMVQNIIERVQRATRLDAVVLAYPVMDHPHFSALHTTGVLLYPYPGDEHDLVGRYLGAAEAYGADIVVRIPCDNPCVDYAYIDAAVENYRLRPYCYYSNTTASVGHIWVDGIGAEMCSRSRWQWLDLKTHGNPSWREHPHRYFEEQNMLMLPPAQIRLDVNTPADYDIIKEIYDHFGHNRFSTAEVLTYLESKPVTA